MPISFSCGQCGKDYLVSDGLAGKKAVCKACNHRMTVPGEPATARPTAVARPATYAEPMARAVPRRAGPVAEDLYGLNEAAPPPPVLPRTAYADATVAEAPVKKKKKKGGFFASSKKKTSSAPGIGSDGGGVVWLIRIVVFVVVIGGGIGGWGLLSKSSMEGYLEKLIAMANEGSTALRSVQDSAAASVVAPRVRGVFTRINDTIDEVKDKKGRDTDVDDVERRYGPRLGAAYSALGDELQRVFSIPGARAALGIDDQLLRLAGGAFSMPQMGPPPMPPQIARPMPVQIPQPGPSPGPQPGFGPGPRPGMPGGPPMGPRPRGGRPTF
jgi:DNA-directed RNA polymerase subunit RPC12/RpoP